MPLYDAQCDACGSTTEFVSRYGSIQDDLPECCNAKMRHVWLSTRLTVIPDIEPYRAVASDIATGKPPTIMGRAQHREFLRRNNYTEVGNEMPKPRREEPVPIREIGQQIKQIIDSKGIRL